MEATGQAFVAIGASMDVRRWNWPGYLTFSKGTLRKAGAQEQQPEEKPVETAAAAEEDSIVGEPVPPSPRARIQGEVDRDSLHEAMSTDGIRAHDDEETVGDEHASPTDSESASQIVEITADADITLLTVNPSPQDVLDPSPPASPSTPVVHPPTLILPPSPSSSQGTLPIPVPTPSFRLFSLHFSPHDEPLATAQRQALYIIVGEPLIFDSH
jgi:hypothetical protein